MKNLKILFLINIMPVMACLCLLSCKYETNYTVKITNRSEHNITWVVIVDTKTGNVITDEKDNELIAKNGGSRTFELGDMRNPFIACVEAEDTLEPICTTVRDWNASGGRRSIAWIGPDASNWLPAVNFPSCPKLFPQCNPEIKDE